MVTKTEKNKVCRLLSFKKGTKIDFDLYLKTLISVVIGGHEKNNFLHYSQSRWKGNEEPIRNPLDHKMSKWKVFRVLISQLRYVHVSTVCCSLWKLAKYKTLSLCPKTFSTSYFLMPMFNGSVACIYNIEGIRWKSWLHELFFTRCSIQIMAKCKTPQFC